MVETQLSIFARGLVQRCFANPWLLLSLTCLFWAGDGRQPAHVQNASKAARPSRQFLTLVLEPEHVIAPSVRLPRAVAGLVYLFCNCTPHEAVRNDESDFACNSRRVVL